MQIFLPNPHINQKKILECEKRFIVVMCGRRFGKSELSQIKCITTAIKGGQVAYITPTYKLAKVFFEKLCNSLPFPNNKSDLNISFPNGGKVEFFTGERLDNLRGRKFNLVIVDEASFIPNLEDGWLNSIRPTLTDYKGKAIFLSTPKGKNYFFSLFSKAEPDWQSFKFTTYDNVGLDEDGNVAYFDRFQMDWHNTKQTILRLPKCPILVDSTGVGDPILEDLQREGVMIQGLKFTSSSKQQLMEGLQAAIHQGKIGYPDGIISQELEVFEYQYTATGVKYSAPSGFHDDAVMALALAWQNFSLKRGTGRYAFL